MKRSFLLAIAAAVLALCGCTKDQELYDKVDDLGNRVSTLEEQVKELNQITIPGMQAIVAAIQGKIYVTSVTPTADGYVIVFSDKSSAVIKNGEDGKDGTNGTNGTNGAKGDKGDSPVVGVVEVDGEFYWAVDGKALLGPDGEKIPVNGPTPKLRINEGKWEVSYDNGSTWSVVEAMGAPGGSTISIEDGDTTVTFYINGEAYTIQKELPFYLVFDQRKDIGVPEGEVYNFTYTIQGTSEGDEIEVDVLSCTAGWEANVKSLPEGDVPGVLAVKNLENKDGKIFIYASNGRGKTDIKSLLFEGGVLTCEADVKPVTAAGGNVTISVTTNMEYEFYVDKTQKWISVLPATKATHTDVYTLVCEANATGNFRSAEVDVINVQTGETEVFIVLQYPSETVATNVASLSNVADNTPVTLYSETVLAYSAISAIVSDGSDYLTLKGISEALPVGKVININGVKKSDEDRNVYVELTSFEVVAETSDVTDPAVIYYGLAANYDLPLYTSVTGPVTKEGDSYVVTAYQGQPVVVESPAAEYDFASLVGKTATVYGYAVSVALPENQEVETITIVANKVAAVEFKENAAWTLSYKNDPSQNASYPEVITNTVSGSTVPYMLGCFSEEAFAEVNGVSEIALSFSDELQYYFWFYGLYGYSAEEVFEILAHADGATGFDSFKELDYGKYYAVAVGVNSDGTPTGDYKVQAFEKVEPKSIATYEDFLGKWVMGGTVLNITEKANGKTYNVTGIPDAEDDYAPAVAEFVDGKLILKEQKTPDTYPNPNYGDVDLYISGIFSSGSSTYAAYPLNTDEPEVIFTGYMFDDSGKVTVYPGTCEYGAFIAFGYSWCIPSGENAGKGNKWTPAAIGDMVKFKDDIPEELLGKWICPEKVDMWGEDTYTNWTITMTKSGAGVAMAGFDAGMDAIAAANKLSLKVPVAVWDDSAHTLTIADSTPTGLATGGNAISWRGFLGEYYCDIVYNVDLENMTMTLAVDGFMAVTSSGAYSGFDAPLVFTKEGAAGSSVSPLNTNAASHPMPNAAVKADSKFVSQSKTAAVAAKVPAQKIIDARVAKSRKASVQKLSK